MNCASCGAAIGDEARFCHACGALVAVEPEERPPAPAHLAARIRSERAAIEGERKQVTILFADIANSLEMAKQTDPEEWRSVMDRCFQLLAVGVHAFEGTVDKFTGDGLMAIFGAPLAHEDHARRACLAALELRSGLAGLADELRASHGLELGIRIGINSGEVVVGSIGERGDMAYTAIGHTVGLAQRMEQLAEPGQICLSAATATLVGGYFQLGEPESREVKGAGTVEVYELKELGKARDPLDLARARGLTPLVGRDEELAALERAFEAGLSGGGQLVGIVGEPGVGKSRLCHELAERCRARGAPVFQVAAQAHARNVSLLPVLTLLRDFFGVSESDAEPDARQGIEARVAELDPALAEELPLLFDFLGVPDPDRPVERMDPEARQRRLLDLVRRLIHAQSNLDPALTIFEDLQWIDPSSEAFLLAYVEAVHGTRGLTVLNFRPDYSAPWMSRSFYRQIPLGPLDPSDEADLLAELLGADPSLEPVRALITERAAGNPFFTEELVRSLTESGSLAGSRGEHRLVAPVDESEVPVTVQAVLAARIDRLPREQKAALEAAAVIGKEFTAPLLAAISELEEAELQEVISALVAAEFVNEQSVGAELAYAFRHPLTQEVAYRAQLRERREALHSAAATAIIDQHPDQLDERAGLIATHWERAGERLEAARWHARSATWSGYSDAAESVRHWRRVAEIADELPETEETIMLGLAARVATLHFGWRLGLSGEEADRIFEEAEILAAKVADVSWRILLLGGFGAVKGIGQGDVQEYARLARDAVAIAEEAGDLTLLLPPNAYAFFATGDLEEGLEMLDRVIEAAGGDPSVKAGMVVACPLALSLAHKGALLTSLGELDAAHAAFDEALSMALEQRDPETVAHAHGLASRLAYVEGDTEGALEHSRTAVQTSERIGDALSRVWSWSHLGVAELMRGDSKSAIAALEQAIELADEHRAAADGRAMRLGHLAEAYLMAGDSARAYELADQAVVAAEAQGGPVALVPARLAMARVLLAAQDEIRPERVESEMAALLDEIERTGARVYEPFVHAELAELALHLGDDARRERELAEARSLFAAMGATARAEQLDATSSGIGAGERG